jgi:tol-pal system protein YbgF
LAGCGGDALLHAQMTDLQKKLDDTQRRAAAAERKSEDLQDQVFLLTDKLESQKVAAGRAPAPTPPRLPVVLLHPDAPKEPGGEEEIAFEGAARSADPAHARPQLVLDGASAPKKSKTQTPTQTPTAPSTAVAHGEVENLGVAPVPPINAGVPLATGSREATRLAPLGSPIAAAPRGEDHSVIRDDALKLYRAAYDALRAGHHDEAVRGFRDLVKRFPDHELADNAQYWLGECYYDRKLFTQAIPEFRLVVTRYPLGNKAPDALLKLAYCLLALGDLQKGKDLLQQVPASYPHTEAARLAELRLGELRSTGGTQ